MINTAIKEIIRKNFNSNCLSDIEKARLRVIKLRKEKR